VSGFPLPSHPDDRVPPEVAAAKRIIACLDEARAGNFFKDAWYFYMRRSDVEIVAKYLLETPAKPLVEPKERTASP
jgi:hypothetical protein